MAARGYETLGLPLAGHEANRIPTETRAVDEIFWRPDRVNADLRKIGFFFEATKERTRNKHLMHSTTEEQYNYLDPSVLEYLKTE